MALSRNDKFLILGAVVLAFSVVIGMAIWKKPHLFFGETKVIDSRLSADSSSTQQQQTQVTPSTPTSMTTTATPPIPVAVQAPPTPTPTSATPTPTPQMSASMKKEDEKKPPKPLAGEGQKTLDRMFAELEREAQSTPRPKPTTTATQSQIAAPEVVLPEYTPTPAPARPTLPKNTSRTAKPTPKTESKAKPEPKSAPKATSQKPASSQKEISSPKETKPGRGQVISISPSDKPEEFVLTIKTNAPVRNAKSFYLADPPRFVVDIPGQWEYKGRNTLSGKSSIVNKIRIGKHKDKLRIVIDLTPGSVNRLRGRPEVKTASNGAFVVIPK